MIEFKAAGDAGSFTHRAYLDGLLVENETETAIIEFHDLELVVIRSLRDDRIGTLRHPKEVYKPFKQGENPNVGDLAFFDLCSKKEEVKKESMYRFIHIEIQHEDNKDENRTETWLLKKVNIRHGFTEEEKRSSDVEFINKTEEE